MDDLYITKKADVMIMQQNRIKSAVSLSMTITRIKIINVKTKTLGTVKWIPAFINYAFAKKGCMNLIQNGMDRLFWHISYNHIQQSVF